MHEQERVGLREVHPPDAAEAAPTLDTSPPEPHAEGPPRGAAFRFSRGQLYAAVIPLAFVTGLATGFLFWGRNRSQAQTASRPGQPAAQTRRLDVSVDDDPALGPKDAPVTIVEFSDFNCPFCRKFHQETFRDLLAAYPDQIRFVYRDFPIVGGGAVGFVAAQAANCAGEQGAYWEYHDALFSGRYPLGMEGYAKYAEELGLDSLILQDCINRGQFAEEVQTDARYASSLGVTGTPTFFINGIPLVGAQPLSSFAAVIESELDR